MTSKIIDMELKHLTQNEAQQECQKAGAIDAVYIDTPRADGACFGTVHLAGLCPRCKEPIGFHFTNGCTTLRLEHLFIGDVRCQNAKILEQIKNFSGQQKSEFFTDRHDESILREAGFSEDEIQKRLAQLKAR